MKFWGIINVLLIVKMINTLIDLIFANIAIYNAKPVLVQIKIIVKHAKNKCFFIKINV